MIKGIITTTFSKLFTAIISLIIVVINARALGAAGVAEIGLIILDVSIISMIGGMLGGSAIVYYASRSSLRFILKIALSGSILAPLFFAILIMFTYFINPPLMDVLIPKGFTIHILILASIQIMLSNLNSIFLGRKKIFWQNINSSIQYFILIVSTLIFFNVMHKISVDAFLLAMALSTIIPLMLDFIMLSRLENNNIQSTVTLPELLKFSITMQLASLVQLFNYRLNYYLVKKYFGIQSLGVFAAGNQLSEGIWIVPKSISLVQFSEISNSINPNYNRQITNGLLWLTLVLTTIGVLVIVILPEEFYLYLLGPMGFKGIKTVIFYLAPGIVFLSLNMIIAHYLSGIGKPVMNLYSSSIGLVVVILAGILLIPEYGVAGASISSSLSYFSSLSFSITIYILSIKQQQLASQKESLSLWEIWKIIISIKKK